MFDQIDSAFQKGIAEHTNAAQQRFDSGHSQLAHTLRVRWKIILLTALLWLENAVLSFFFLKPLLVLQETITSASSVAQALSRELAESQRNLLALAAAGANSGGSNPLVTQLSGGPLGALLDKVCESLELITNHESCISLVHERCCYSWWIVAAQQS